MRAFEAADWPDLEGRALAITQTWPQAAIGWKALGIALLKAGRAAHAIAPLCRALELTPDDVELHFCLGDARRELGQLTQAVASYEAAVRLQPDADLHNTIGGLLFGLKRFADAETHFGRASALRPEVSHFHLNRATTLRHLGRFDEAESGFRYTRTLAPDDVDVHYNFGNFLRSADRLAEAEGSYRRAIALEPGHVAATTSLAQTLAELGRSGEALALFEAALARRPDYELARGNKSLVELRLGNFADGWRNYEWRWHCREFPPPKLELPRPLWLGEQPIAGKTVAVPWEQGFGDTIQFCRYLPMLAARGAKVLFAPQPVLRGLMASLAPTVDLVDLGDLINGQRQYDVWLPLMSLPLAFGTDGTSIPGEVPYLRAEPDRAARWRERVGERGFKIGICWQGRPGKEDRGRSFPLAALAGVARLAGVRLISLHKGDGIAQLSGLPAGMRVETLGEDFDAGPDAFLDTAAVMTLCDLVVTSDTAIAHLAGALGITTWLALMALPDWRWLLDRSDTPWYPTMRLFRQKTRGEWEPVFREIEDEVRRLVDRADPLRAANEAP